MNEPKNYRKKPVTIQAIEWTGANGEAVMDFTGRRWAGYDGIGVLRIETLEGVHRANIGDMIIKGVAGEFYPCKPDIFDATYEVTE